MSLPSYEQAVEVYTTPLEVLSSIIYPWLEGSQLALLTRVSKDFHAAFQPLLWRDPIMMIAQTKTPFSNMVLFMQRVKTAKLATRQYVLVLDFPQLFCLQRHRSFRANFEKETATSAFAPSKLGDLMKLLPEVVYNITDNLPVPLLARLSDIGLLLSARGISLQDDIASFPDMSYLWYLDLSYTPIYKIESPSFSLASMPNLRILKLRDTGLTARFLRNFLEEQSKNLWSVDVRDNRLDLESLRIIVNSLSLGRLPSHHSPDSYPHLHCEPPPYCRDVTEYQAQQVESQRSDKDDNRAKFVLKTLDHTLYCCTHELDLSDDTGLAHPEIIAPTGLTHLYVSDIMEKYPYKITPEEIYELLAYTNRFQVLDVGWPITLPADIEIMGRLWYYKAFPPLGPFLQASGSRLQALRIHHSIVTSIPTIGPCPTRLGSTHLQRLRLGEMIGKTLDNVQPFYPQCNYRLRELMLTHVPQKSTGLLIQRLKDFLVRCSEQEQELLAAKKAGSSNRRAPPLLSGLVRLRLEFEPMHEPGASVSGHPDADVFTRKSAGDFSFFNERSPIPTRPDSPVPESSTSSRTPPSEIDEPPGYLADVLEELKRFRNEVKPKWGGILDCRIPSPSR